jgi:1-carboxybiuret hydrolase subunit AtzG-like protein
MFAGSPAGARRRQDPVAGDDENKERTLTAKRPDSLDDYIDAVSKALNLPVDDSWKPAVRANLEVSLRLARQVDEFALPDETEPASVFAA